MCTDEQTITLTRAQLQALVDAIIEANMRYTDCAIQKALVDFSDGFTCTDELMQKCLQQGDGE